MSIYTANNDTIVTTLANHIFKNYGKQIGDAAIKKNFVSAFLNLKGKVIEAGGLDFTETVLTSENTNIGFRSHYSEIDADHQDPTRTLSFDPKTLDGSIVINEKHKLMNRGRYAIRNLMNTLRQQAETTIKNTVNEAHWNSSPGANEPESLLSLIPADPTTGSIGGVDRATNVWARSVASSTAVTDIGAEGGLKALHKFRRSLGGDAKMSPDFGVTTVENYSALEAYLNTLSRGSLSDAKMVELGFDNIRLGKTVMGYDGDGGTGECPENYVYFLNSECLFMKILEGANYKFEPFTKKGVNLNETSIFYLMYNLTTNLPGALGVMTDVETA